MAEITKKTKSTAPKATTAAKPRKSASKKTADPVAANTVSENHHATKQGRSFSQDEVARLAHSYWQQRGHKHGHHMEDWFRAEQELRSKA